MTVPYQVIDLNPVDRLTAGAIGEPGHRVFFIQGRKGRRLVTVRCEKEHVAALIVAVEQLLLALARQDAEVASALAEADAASLESLELEYPLAPVFRAGDASLGYDQVSKRLVVIIYEQMEEGDSARPSVVRFWASPAQMRALCRQGERAVEAGRPRCAMCGQPIDPGGHFCPRKNGDRTHD